MDCPDVVYDNYYVVLSPMGPATWIVTLAVLLWHLHSVYRPQRIARRFGLAAPDALGRGLVRVLAARNAALAAAALVLTGSLRPTPYITVLCLATFSCLADAIAASRARGIIRALDLWLISAVLAGLVSWFAIDAATICEEAMHGL